METLILILVTLAIIAVVLAVLALKTIFDKTEKTRESGRFQPPPEKPPEPEAPKPEPRMAEGILWTPPKPVANRSDGEMDFFDLSIDRNVARWRCECCGAENKTDGCCQICAAAHG